MGKDNQGGVGYICNACGSPSIYWDAYAVWDHISQSMDLQSSFDFSECNDCGGEEIEVDIETYEKALIQHEGRTQ
jgi:hypothetical protein